ncbi:MAG TPA: hypothetical protein VFQ74_07190 [Pseudolysinimonas sp.]|nr:hypothetical protein [Pseudolysinimonas sp.]
MTSPVTSISQARSTMHIAHSTRVTAVPELVPTLSVGRHRSPRTGACFMEFASYLAGERWSDHPSCTDPTLGTLARAVNDTVRDSRRGELVGDIPRVIGLHGDEVRLGLIVALRAATTALPVASMERQRALAVGIIATTDALAELGVNRPRAHADAERALTVVPDAATWARAHLADWRARPVDLARHGCGAIVRTSALGIAQACIDDPDTLLVAMLRAAIDDAEEFLGRTARGGDAPMALPMAAMPEQVVAAARR